MVRNQADMTEHPDDILGALADPERLRIAGTLAAGDAAVPLSPSASGCHSLGCARIAPVSGRRRGPPAA
ncbi:MAG: hypothetical protein M3138_05025, partial [Actinomycetota bacterium]|nr:hypothetical protein [Actinomycetota bacterium]